jgi:hypothetical protein
MMRKMHTEYVFMGQKLLVILLLSIARRYRN